VIPTSGHGGITIPAEVYATLPRPFRAWYETTFSGQRMIYGHWSEGTYTRALGVAHRQIAVLRPLELDELIDRWIVARNRRIGGAIAAMWHQIEEMKAAAELQVFQSGPYDVDLPDHTRNRSRDSVSIAVMAGRGARLNDLGPYAPIPSQIDMLIRLAAEACVVLRSPAERFLTASEAADNLDWPIMDDPAAPTPPYGFRTSREAWDLEAWIDEEAKTLAAPLQSARPGWVRLGDWLRARVLERIAETTREAWESASP
jgi:hypothetical protein